MDLLLGIGRRFPFIVLIGVVAVGGFVFREHLVGAASDLRAGDCFDEPAEMRDGQAGEVTDVQHRPCGDPHDAEVFAVVSHPAASGAAELTDSAAIAYVAEQCVPAYETYTGRNYERDLDHEIGFFWPNSEGWSSGDRVFSCYLYRIDGGKLSGSLRTAAP